MNDFVTLLLIAIISVGVGIAVGSLISNAMNARQNNSKLKNDNPAGLMETLRVYRDLKTRTVVLKMRGKQYHRPGELDAAAHSFLEQQLVALAGWIKPSGPLSPAGDAVRGLDAQVPPVAQKPVGAPESPRNPAPIFSSSVEDDGPKQSYNPLGVFARALRTDAQKTSFTSTSIAAQIDEILQEKLAGLPDEKRAIRLMELPGKGMVVMIGLKHYDGVDAVPDPEVKALIRECVREWEQKLDRQE
jgi:hypothetical protein